MNPASNFTNRFKALSVWMILFLFSACTTDPEEPVEPGELRFVSSHELDIEDPSGLTLDVSGNFLWTVSDSEGGRIYRITFEGEIINHLEHYRGNDLEGITMNPNDMTLWVVEERLMQVMQLNLDGRVLMYKYIEHRNTNINEGLEGISINPDNEHIYLLHTKNPTSFIELDKYMQIVREVIINFRAPYTMLDLSGLFYDHKEEELWFVSDESMRIVVTDTNLEPIRSYQLGQRKFEGIAVNSEKRTIYLVNDESNMLYIYDY